MIAGLAGVEYARVNLFIPMLAAAFTGIRLLTSDLIGRAFPVGMMTKALVYDAEHLL